MSVTVYGIRLKGDREVRYIGFTRGDLDARLKKHIGGMVYKGSFRPFVPWIKEHRHEVEIFPIAKCDTVAEARKTESVLIALCCRLNQRLLNGAQVPPRLRLVA
jgi:hypothetical protein